MKSCAYKSFCDKAHMSNGAAVKLECCFSDDCNGPHHAHSHTEHGGATSVVASSSTLLMGVVIIRLAAGVML